MKQSTLELPRHLAIIMDGNGRWAERAGRPRSWGHIAGARAMRQVVEHCARTGIEQLTVYAFSADNWKRPANEVGALLSLFTSHFRTEAEVMAREGIRVSAIGQRTRLPRALRAAITNAEAQTAHSQGMHLRVAIDYSSRAAIARGEADLLPPVDLLVRTGGERRLSDFLLWECAYAELLFLDVLWPDITAAHLDDAIADYASRDRRFGSIPHRASA